MGSTTGSPARAPWMRRCPGPVRGLVGAVPAVEFSCSYPVDEGVPLGWGGVGAGPARVLAIAHPGQVSCEVSYLDAVAVVHAAGALAPRTLYSLVNKVVAPCQQRRTVPRQGATRLLPEAGDRVDEPCDRLYGADQKPCELLRFVPGQTSAGLRHYGFLLACPAADWFPLGTGPARSGTCPNRS